jgi:recombination protein RecT
MAGSNGTALKDKLQKRTEEPESGVTRTLQGLLSLDSIKQRFAEVLGDKAPGFISSIISLTNSSPRLKDCDPKTVIGAAAIAASLDLPINPSLGFAWIIPREIKDRGWVAQFQLGYKGTIQLALRSGQYKTIHVGPAYEGELEEPSARERLTGEIRFREGGRTSGKITDYVAYFRLVNGFEKWRRMTVEEVTEHAKRFSPDSWKNPRSPWHTDFDAMACKTVLKRLLSHYGPLSVQMQQAVLADQSVVRELGDGTQQFDYTDNVYDTTADAVPVSADGTTREPGEDAATA